MVGAQLAVAVVEGVQVLDQQVAPQRDRGEGLSHLAERGRVDLAATALGTLAARQLIADGAQGNRGGVHGRRVRSVRRDNMQAFAE